MPAILRIGILVGLLILLDGYAYRGLRTLTDGLAPHLRKTAVILWWSIHLIFWIGLLAATLLFWSGNRPSPDFMRFIGIGLILLYAPKIVFMIPLLLEDGYRLIRGGGVAAAQVALLHLAGVLHVVHRAEGAGDRADLAADAHAFQHHLGARGGVHLDRLDRAGVQAPRLVALGARVGHLAAGVVEIEDLDARLGGIEDLVVLVRTGHFALQAPGALRRVDVERFLHGVLLLRMGAGQLVLAAVGRGHYMHRRSWVRKARQRENRGQAPFRA